MSVARILHGTRCSEPGSVPNCLEKSASRFIKGHMLVGLGAFCKPTWSKAIVFVLNKPVAKKPTGIYKLGGFYFSNPGKLAWHREGAQEIFCRRSAKPLKQGAEFLRFFI